ncbi:Splicing factor 3A subunit 1 [Trichoplax sp. H2]|nr:Splicing factor 3A subunit 1 [Trichoplax sp. H2]|eukprot:RDD44977.1 Splicing factor 3A subunit 1 [Trichoplax sp. H2]
MPSVEASQIETNGNGEQNIEEEPSKPVIGIIYPPPEVRNIVDKTASFVARNGLEFETRIRHNEANNPKFNFLNSNDPYHAYYQHKLINFREGNSTTEPPVPLSLQEQQQQHQLQQQKQQQSIQSQITETFIPKDPPPAPQFIAEPPSISAFDLDLVKLTALFVARNGRQFLTNLMSREHNNYQFDFLKPQHSLFQYFTKLVEQYTNVLIPPKDIVQKLKEDCRDSSNILDRVKYAVNWGKYKEEQRQKEEAEQDRERIAFAQVDWHDFVVVETVPFKDDEKDNLPPPVTPEELGIRIIAQQRYEEEQRTTEVEMEVDEDDQESSPPPLPPTEADNASMPPPLPPVANAVVKKDYDPKSSKKLSESTTQYLISPLTGEKVPVDKMDEHMKYGLLDPEWRSDRDRSMKERMEQLAVYAVGGDIGDHLKNLASRRTDIFGAADEETIIGKKIGEDEIAKAKDQKAIWDGHSGSMGSVTRAARANITTEDVEMAEKRAAGITGKERIISVRL